MDSPISITSGNNEITEGIPNLLDSSRGDVTFRDLYLFIGM